ncbi:EAL domain-containing protein [Sphingomonas psychrotolerans]|uniref:EAL domain-containing protein n=1 Tax=Sphingomonas psychrotolerans TaxID=1327635 RepID=A0ABU3N6Q2_9SPHN|nr:EAL domain-containing protein [Sphingomonas psychrotolerans]MDT8759136.1 EAL domain-containing protein [Sphingomonas psychrotolerans]
MTNQPATLSTATLNRADPRLDLVIGFRPMIAKGADRPFAWQAVASGVDGRSFAAISAALLPEQRPALEARRITLALERAAELGIHCGDALIALPLGAAAGLAEPLLSHLFRAALVNGVPTDRLVLEISADERGDFDQAAALADACTRRGLSITLDGFAAGPVALKLLARFTPRFVKLDPSLVRGIDGSASRRLMAEGVMRLARNMGVTVIARGVENRGEHDVLHAMGVRHFQIGTAAVPQAETPRREPRGVVPPVHRRLAHHNRPAFPLRAPRADTALTMQVA